MTIEQIKQNIVKIIADLLNTQNKYQQAILDCWELLEAKPHQQRFPHLTDEEILDNQAGLIERLRNILEPVVDSIHKEGQ